MRKRKIRTEAVRRKVAQICERLDAPQPPPADKRLLKGMPIMAHLSVYRHRFWSRVEKTETCWLWKGAKAAHGYGQFSMAGFHVRAHRYAYFLKWGALTTFHHIHHRCGNPACVNPDHLESLGVAEHRKKHQPSY